MSPAGFEPTIPASERPQIHAFDRAATGIGKVDVIRQPKAPVPIRHEAGLILQPVLTHLRR
jgi:hypothetical protein